MARPAVAILVRLFVAVVLALLAYDDATFGVERRNAAGIVIWFLVIILVGFGLAAVRLTRTAVAVVALLGALAVWTFLSLLWTPSAEWSFNEFGRVAVYAGVLLLAQLLGHRAIGTAVDGIAAGIVAVAVVALVSRFFPSVFPDRGLISFLPDAGTRLSFPIGYWNGLAIFVALAVPLLLGRATAAGPNLARGLALAPVPALVAVSYLASSRGGIVAAAVGGLVLLGLAADRWLVLAAAVVAVAGSALEIALLETQHRIVDGPLGTDAAVAAGHRAALLTVFACAATGAVWAAAVGLVGARRPSPRAGWALAAAAAGLLLVAFALSHPGRRFETFKQPPSAVSFQQGSFAGSHLASGAGSGRWQFWAAAVDQWRAHPVLGEGAGTFPAWWLEHGSIAYYVRDAHSLYLQSFGELGVVGGLLTLAFVALGLVGGGRRALSAGADRTPVAAGCAAFAAFAAGAALDWVWQLPAVTIAAVALLGLTLTADRPVRLGRLRGGGLALLLAGWLVIVALVIPFVARLKLDASESAARRGDLASARAHADTARSVQPWAATPYLQLALVDEERGNLVAARREIARATARNSVDWRLWLVRARLATKAGAIADARASLDRARRLNPRSGLFSGS